LPWLSDLPGFGLGGSSRCEAVWDQLGLHPVNLRLNMPRPDVFAYPFWHGTFGKCARHPCDEAFLPAKVERLCKIIKQPQPVRAAIKCRDGLNTQFLKSRQSRIPGLHFVPNDPGKAQKV
jgi:hypothetical protein